MRSRGATRRNAPKREGNANAARYAQMRYPLRNSSFLTKEAINIIRTGALMGNFVYYFRHAQIAYEIRDEDFVWSSGPYSEERACSSSALDCADNDARSTGRRVGDLASFEGPLAPWNTSKAGAANVEASPANSYARFRRGIPDQVLPQKPSASAQLRPSLGALSRRTRDTPKGNAREAGRWNPPRLIIGWLTSWGIPAL